MGQVTLFEDGIGPHLKSCNGQIKEIVRQHRPDLSQFEDHYRDIHKHPDLPRQEARTAALAAAHLRSLSFEVFEGIGGYSAVGVLKNGRGRSVMLRAEMDGLPVREQTGLPYASTSFQNDEFGVLRPTMHACGHDMHVAALMAASTLLYSARHLWNGTVIALFQPNEERTGGAQAMVDDGLYSKVPKPDVLLGQHIEPFNAGEIRIKSGDMLVHADSIDIRVFGAPGPKMNPQDCANPTVMACKIVVRLDEIVAKEVSPDDYALLSIWDFKAGIKEDDAWGWVDMNVDLQTYRKEVRERVIASIRRIVEEEAKAAGATTAPIIKTRVRAHTTWNSPEIVEPVRRIFEEVFHVEGREREENAEDFSVLARPFKTPYAYWSVGATDHATWEDAERKNDIANLIPVNHSPFFAPAIQPTLRVATDALALAALTFLQVDVDNTCRL